MSAHDAAGTRELPLGARVRALIGAPAWRDTFRALFDQELPDVGLGWPRLVSRAEREPWLRASDVIVELARSPAREPLELAIILHAESATRLVDRLLGGAGNSGLASRAGQPSEAECGVLAYAAARLCPAHSGFVVRDVRACGHAGAEQGEPMLLWPLALRASSDALEASDWAREQSTQARAAAREHGTQAQAATREHGTQARAATREPSTQARATAREQSIDGALLLSPELARTHQERHELEVLVRDFAVADALAELAPGDVLVSDAWNLTSTTEGIAGDVVLAVAGCESGWSARLAHGRLLARAPSGPARSDQLELVLGRHPLSLLELAELASGTPLSLPASERVRPSLRCAGRTLAFGELVTWRGAVGIRIEALA